MGTSIYSPLFGGVLTGKYINETPQDSRGNIKNERSKKKFLANAYFKNKEKFDAKLKQLTEFAEQKLNCTLAQLALAWVIANPDISVCILGASKGEQIDENVKALEIYKKLNKELLVEIEKILENVPKGEIDFSTWKELPSRRNIAIGIDYVPSDK